MLQPGHSQKILQLKKFHVLLSIHAVGFGILLNPLNSSMISVAIARLQHVFRLDYSAVSRVIFSFYIASAIAQPVMGKASDLFGRRNIFLSGLVVVSVSSFLAPLSQAFGWLIVFRVVQSTGKSMMVSVGMAIVKVHITEKQAAALSVLSIFLSGAAAIGPFIGGVLIHAWDWPAIFFVNIPFVVASFLMARKAIPKDEPPVRPVQRKSLREWIIWMDAPGILLFTTGLVALLIGLLSEKSAGHAAVGFLGFVVLGGDLDQYRIYASQLFVLRAVLRASVLFTNSASCQRIPNRSSHAKLRFVLAHRFSVCRSLDR